MKALIYLVLVSIILNSQLLFSQKYNAIRFKIDGKYLKKNPENNKIVCSENSIITINVNSSLLPKCRDGKFKLVLLPSAGNNSASYMQTPALIDASYLEFHLTNFKKGEIYHYRLVYRKSTSGLEIQDKSMDTLFKSDVEKETKNIYTYKVESNNLDSVIKDFFIEPHDTYHLQISFGGYLSNAHFPVFALEPVPGEDLSFIRDLGPKSTQGVLIGGTFFFYEHDDKCFKKPGYNIIDNFLLRPLGIFVGLGFSAENKGLDNFLVGLNYGIYNFNLIAGINHLKVNTLNPGYNVNEKFKVSDVNKIISSKYIGHLFFGISTNANILNSAIGALLTVAGL